MLKIIDSDNVRVLDWVYFTSDPLFFDYDVRHRLLVWREGEIEIFGLGFDPNDDYLFDVLNFISERVGCCQPIDKWEVVDVKFNQEIAKLYGRQ